MRRIAALLLLCPLLAYGDEAQQIFAKASPGALTIRTFAPDGQTEAMASGLILGREQALTACHAVENVSKIEVQSADGVRRAATLSGLDRANDLCLLTVPALTGPAVALRLDEPIRVGEAVYALGNPLGLGLAISSGRIIGTAEDQRKVFSNAPISPGSSGGGLFDASGRLVGVTTAAFSVNQSFGMASGVVAVDQLRRSGGDPPARSEAAVPPDKDWFEIAAKLEREENFKALLEHCIAWRREYPSSLPAAIGMAQAYIGLQDQKAGEAILTELRAAKIAHSRIHALQAFIFSSRKQYAEAEAELLKAIALDPSVDRYWVSLADTQQKIGRVEDAKQSIKQALLRNPGNARTWRIAGDLESQTKNEALATRFYKTALRLQPGDADTGKGLADSLNKQGLHVEAGKALGDTKADTPDAARKWVETGIIAAQNNKFSDAEYAYKKALEANPGNKDARLNLSLVMLRTQRAQEAEKLLRDLLREDPELAIAQGQLGIVLWERGNKTEAIKQLEAAVQKDRSQSAAWRALGYLYFDAFQYARAATAYEQVPQSEMKAEDWTKLGESYTKLNRLVDSTAAFDRAQKLNPESLSTLLGMATYHGKAGRNEEALKAATRATELYPGSVEGWSSKGYALLLLKRFPEAIEALETAIRLDPNSINALINLGNAYLQSKQLGKAIQNLNRVVELQPNAVPIDARNLLIQAYALSGQYKRAREHSDVLIAQSPQYAGTWYLACLVGLTGNDQTYAESAYIKLKSLDPAMALQAKRMAESSPLIKVKLPN